MKLEAPAHFSTSDMSVDSRQVRHREWLVVIGRRNRTICATIDFGLSPQAYGDVQQV